MNGLLAFHRYRDGEPGPGGVINHSFQHVTDVASSAMKAIVRAGRPPTARGCLCARIW